MLLLVCITVIFISSYNTDACMRSTYNETRIEVSPQNHKVKDRGTVSFFCKAAGNPLPDIYWTRNGRKVKSQRTRYDIIETPGGSILRIDPVKLRRDNTTFECVIDGADGDQIIESADLLVYPRKQVPHGFPEIQTNPSLKAVEKGRTTIMTCSATGDPAPFIMWLKDNIPLDTTLTRYTQMTAGHLQIHDAVESDEGRYECVAVNTVGEVYSRAANLYVRVRRVAPHFTIRPLGVITVHAGDDVNITCAAAGNPVPYVKWVTSVGESVTSAEPEKSSLVLSDVRIPATYTCIAVSDLGRLEWMTEVKVKGD